MFDKPLLRADTPMGHIAYRERAALNDALSQIETLDDAAWFLARLDATPNWWGTLEPCRRATEARRWLQKETWQSSPDRIRTAIIAQRGIICACHETHCFSPTAERGGVRDDDERVLSCFIPDPVQWHDIKEDRAEKDG